MFLSCSFIIWVDVSKDTHSSHAGLIVACRYNLYLCRIISTMVIISPWKLLLSDFFRVIVGFRRVKGGGGGGGKGGV